MWSVYMYLRSLPFNMLIFASLNHSRFFLIGVHLYWTEEPKFSGGKKTTLMFSTTWRILASLVDFSGISYY